MNEFTPGIDLNVVLLPDNNTSQKLIGLSEEVAREVNVRYKLDRTDRPPHLSLYSARYPLHNLTKIRSVMEELAGLAREVEVELVGFSVFSGYLFYDATRNKSLMRLHESVVDALNPFREGLISQDQRGLFGLTEQQKAAIAAYGYASVKDTFMPHVTLAHLTDSQQAEEATKVLPKEVLTFTPASLSLVPFDLDNTLQKPVQLIQLTPR